MSISPSQDKQDGGGKPLTCASSSSSYEEEEEELVIPVEEKWEYQGMIELKGRAPLETYLLQVV